MAVSIFLLLTLILMVWFYCFSFINKMQKINVRENGRDNQEWTILRHRQHWSQDEGKQKQNTHRKLKG